MEDNEKVNLLVSEDDLIPEPKVENNIDKQYTEELDFSNLDEELAKAKEEAAQIHEEVKAVPLEPVYDAVEVPEYDDAKPAFAKPIEHSYDAPKEESEANEHPAGKIKLNTEEEKPEENINPKDIKVDIKGNKSLLFVLGLGLFILVIIFLLPLLV